MSSQLHDDSYLVVNNQDVAAKVVDGEAILINLTSGLYYSMDKVGGFVWSMFEPGSSVAQVVDAVAARYSVPPAQAREDVRRLARELLEENLVVLSTGTPAAVPSAGLSGARPQPYVAPALVRFDDMADMFALDPPLPELPAVRTGST
jgi:Coenzyme PQQ synthesis protein D (PqqD)